MFGDDWRRAGNTGCNKGLVDEVKKKETLSFIEETLHIKNKVKKPRYCEAF